MGFNVADRVSKHRAGLRALGLRPVQIWVPDTRSQEFAVECQRQSALVAGVDHADTDMMAFLDAAVTDLGHDAE